MRVFVVGAGLAGLTCAKVLDERGHEVAVFESSDGVGGRVRTDEREGFLLDRGFQVYFTSYPAARGHLDHEALDLRAFDPGAIVHRGPKRAVLSDPLRDPRSLALTLVSSAATLEDKVRTARVAAAAFAERGTSAGEMDGSDERSTLAYLRDAGFSERYIDSFFKPFFGGVLLNRELETSSRVFRFVFKMLASGRTVVPARGMGEIPRQLASRLPGGSIHLRSPVDELLKSEDRVVGVRVGGEEREADAVVVATEAPEAGRLTGANVPEGSVGEVCLYYETSGLGSGKKILLNAERGAFVNNAVEMSNISERYAPEGRNLLYAVSLQGFELSDEDLYRRGVEELGGWYPEADFRPLGVRRIPYGQFRQPPGVHGGLPSEKTGTQGLTLAGEYTRDSSINGAMLSGERAANEAVSL